MTHTDSTDTVEMDDMDTLPIKVAAYLIHADETSEDPSARALFANMDRAESYARLLADSSTYADVYLWDAEGAAWLVPATVLVNSDGEVIDA